MPEPCALNPRPSHLFTILLSSLFFSYMRDIVYFDLETQQSFRDVDNRLERMTMSLGVTYSTADAKYEIFSEARADALVDRLRRADLVVGFNVLNFDYAVLMSYTIFDLPNLIPTRDLLADIERSLGHRLSLDSVAQASLGVGKTGDGLDAIRWFREGRLAEVAEYCCYDVKVTRLVHEYGAKNGHILYTDRSGNKQQAVVQWAL